MKRMAKMTPTSEFIASPALEETIVTNCPKYREKFSKITEKADVQESDTKDEQAKKKIISTFSWNWAAFLFSYLWLIYRRENLLGWGLLIVVWGLTLIWAYWEDTTLDTITDILPMAVSIAVGMGSAADAVTMRVWGQCGGVSHDTHHGGGPGHECA